MFSVSLFSLTPLIVVRVPNLVFVMLCDNVIAIRCIYALLTKCEVKTDIG